MIKQLSINSRQRIEFIEITAQVQDAVRESGIGEGLCVVFVPHTTAGITINEGADPSVQRDINTHLSHLVPSEHGFQHSEGNSDAHIKASLMGSSCTIPVEGGRLSLGTWQAVYFCEFDGPRSRNATIKLMKG